MRWIYILMGLPVLFLMGCIGGEPIGVAQIGEDLFKSKGCNACHTTDGSSGTGPTWKGLYGSQVTLDTGEKLTADDAYLRESILDPDAKIVEGFDPGLMSAVIPPGSITDEEADALVAYIKTLS
jgi:cytochrome c oxidase subunit 2